MHQLFFCNNAKRLWDIGRNVVGTNELIIAENDLSTISKLIEVSPSIPSEIVKSVIFKLLIQIDRSSNLNDTDIRRIISQWLNIEYLALSKSYKNNKSQLDLLKSISSNLIR